jgi:hypothetical protein
MADADSLTGDIRAATRGDVHPSPRLHAYQTAFDTLRLAGGIQRRVSGDTTIVILTAPLEPTFPALDDKTAIRTSRHGRAYRAIAPHWYLVYDW